MSKCHLHLQNLLEAAETRKAMQNSDAARAHPAADRHSWPTADAPRSAVRTTLSPAAGPLSRDRLATCGAAPQTSRLLAPDALLARYLLRHPFITRGVPAPLILATRPWIFPTGLRTP